MKCDQDDLGHGRIKRSGGHREQSCLFCNTKTEHIVEENDLAYFAFDSYPVTEMHALVVPKRHVSSYFELEDAEVIACTKLIKRVKNKVETEDHTVSGFNIGVNVGADAGQSIFHCHIHVIPRRKGDVENPQGGVRHTIPGKGHYTKRGNKSEWNR